MVFAMGRFLRRPVWSNTAATIALRGFATLTRLVVLFLIARAVDPNVFGMIVFTLATVEIAKVVADFGVDTLAIRDFAVLPTLPDQHMLANNISSVKVVLGFGVYLFLIALFFVGPFSVDPIIGMSLGLLVVTSSLNNFSIDYFQSKLRTHTIIAPLIATNIVAIGIVAVLAFVYPSVVLLLLVLPTLEAVAALLLVRRLQRELGTVTTRLRLASLKHLLRRSLPIAATAIVVTFYTRLDVFVISAFFDNATVGFYGAAFRVTEPFQLAAIAFIMSIYSHLSRVIAASEENPARLIVRYCVGTLIYGVVTAFFLIAIVPFFFAAFLPQYLPAVDILRLLAVALIFRTLNGCLTSAVQAYGRFSWITAVAVWNLVIISGLLFVCVPQFGAPGAALALLIGEIANTIIQATMLRYVLRREAQLGRGTAISEPHYSLK